MSKKNKIDIAKLKGADLFDYYKFDCKDKEYASVVVLLPYAVLDDFNKACTILERVVRENKKLIAFYPEFDTFDTSNMEYIGCIMDGGLYIK